MSNPNSSRPMYAFLLAFTGVVFFSSKAVLVKLAYNYDVDAVSLLSLRLLFALPIYVAVLLSTWSKKKMKAIKRTDYYKIIALGFLGYYLASLLDFAGLHYLSASLERLILFVYPTMVLLISAVIFRKRATTAQKIAVGITYFGVSLAFFRNTAETGSNVPLGALLIFLSAFSYAAFLVGSGNLIPRFGTKLFTSLAMIISCVAALIHFVSVEGLNLFSFEKEVYYISVIMAIVCTVIPSFLIAEAIKQMGASNVAVVGSFGPVSTIILAAIFLGERITVFQMIGTLIVISGVLVLALYKDKSKDVVSKKVR